MPDSETPPGLSHDEQRVYAETFAQLRGLGFQDAAARISALNKAKGTGIAGGDPLPKPPARARVVDLLGDPVRTDEAMLPAYGGGEIAAHHIEPREWIVDQWFPAKSNIVFGGHGGIGKSLLVAMLATCVASGSPFYGLPTARGGVVIYSAEDDLNEWVARTRAAAVYLGVDLAELPLRIVDALDSDVDPALFAPPAADPKAEAAITPVGQWFAEQFIAEDDRLLIFDSATDTFGGDENTRREVRRYLRMARRRFTRFGAAAVHILHIDKRTARAGGTSGDDYSGVTDWNNGVRARVALYRPRRDEEDEAPDDGTVRLELQKSNYSKRGAWIDLRYDPELRVFTKVGESAEILLAATGGTLPQDERQVLQAMAAAEDAGDPFLSAERANRNPAARLSAIGELPRSFSGRAGKRRLFAALLRWKNVGWLREENLVTEQRNRVTVWRVTAAGRAFSAA